jgi:hypothetical protein
MRFTANLTGMEMEELEITINPEGGVSIAVKGHKGPSCLEATRRLEEAVGCVTEREFCPDYYQQGEMVGVTDRLRVK